MSISLCLIELNDKRTVHKSISRLFCEIAIRIANLDGCQAACICCASNSFTYKLAPVAHFILGEIATFSCNIVRAVYAFLNGESTIWQIYSLRTHKIHFKMKCI